MKKILLATFWLLCVMSSVQAQNAVVFDEMLRWLNTDPLMQAGSCNNGFSAIMTNNTIRTNGSGQIYQYASVGQGNVGGRCRCFNHGNLAEMNLVMKQAFSDRNYFQGGKDEIGYRFFKQGTQINVEITLYTWGNAKSTVRGVEVLKTALGYAIRWHGGGGYQTITFIKSGQSSSDCIG
jgi:hypothetical protein